MFFKTAKFELKITEHYRYSYFLNEVDKPRRKTIELCESFGRNFILM